VSIGCRPGRTAGAEHGGFGLRLGNEGLNRFDHGLAGSAKGLVDPIVLFAGAPADTASANVGTRGDGKRFRGPWR
jgi:hypothetical protein